MSNQLTNPVILTATLSNILKARNMLAEASPPHSLDDLEAGYFSGDDWKCTMSGKNFCVEVKPELASWLLLQVPTLKTIK